MNEEEFMRHIIRLDQELCAVAIKRIQHWKRVRFWLVLGHVLWFVVIWASLEFYRRQYWSGMFDVFICMALVSFHWTNIETLIRQRRIEKTAWAMHKLEIEKCLTAYLRRKEQGFE